MTARARKLLREALALPVDERAAVAAGLLASLEDVSEEPAEVAAAWAAEIERRALTGRPAEASSQDARTGAESGLRKR